MIAAAATGVLLPERLLLRDAGALFFAGAFAVVVGTFMFRFWRLGEQSLSYFRWSVEDTTWENEAHFVGAGRYAITVGQNRGEAFELKPRTQHAICVVLALMLGLACIDSRALGLIARFEHTVTTATGSYCPEVETKTVAEDPNAPGCELIRRAYALGYAKDLGECGAHQQISENGAICTLRQRDEPFAHYAFRLLDEFWTNVRTKVGPDYFRDMKKDFDAKMDRLASIRAARAQVLSSAPHASHHIFTTLPDPKDGAFREENCADRYRFMPHRPADGDPSRVFEHVVAQLLFESRYQPAAGYCREYQVHWGAPADACAQLAKDPVGFLEKNGALSPVRAALERYKVANELAALGAGPPPTQKPQGFVSFQCYAEGPEYARTSTPFQLDGVEFLAEQLTVPPETPGATLFVDRYDAVAKLLVRGFHYGALLSEAGIEPGVAEGLEPSFQSRDFLMSRLYGLENLDIYLGPGWLSQRPDLLEVYPYQLHLQNYVTVFRRQYRRERGRL